ncbi:unnamed protein product [Amoebophrya sp. A25]|nr:unnamed protein product [Amoebophrya sp. A25]|eukprot:GSA25T00020904001.1
MDALEEQIVNRFKAKCLSQPETAIAKHLRYYDLQNCGKLSYPAFRKSMEQYAIGADERLLQGVHHRYCQDSDELMDIRYFARAIVDGSVRKMMSSSAAPVGAAYGGGAGEEAASPWASAAARPCQPKSPRGSYNAAQGKTSVNSGGVAPSAMDVLTVDQFLKTVRSLLYPQGVMGLMRLLLSINLQDTENQRVLPLDIMSEILREACFNGGNEENIKLDCEYILPAWADPYERDLISYDDFLAELKIPLNEARRHAVRAAYRKLDHEGEAFVDFRTMAEVYNASRHPYAIMGSATSEVLYQTFVDSFETFIAFRRGVPLGDAQSASALNRMLTSGSAAGSKIPWEEFEDYYKTVSGCFTDDSLFTCMLERTWDVDKDKKAFALQDSMPAAGAKAKHRVDLHHWQQDTLIDNHTYRNVGYVANLEQVFREAAQYLSRKGGIRMAMDTVKSYVLADDNVDDLIDRTEFRRASTEAGLRFTNDEEADIFQLLGKKTQAGGPAASGDEVLLPVFTFLKALFGAPMKSSRLEVVYEAWANVAGSAGAQVTPQTLKESVSFDHHPEVLREPGDEHAKGKVARQLTSEFLDTFSLYVNVLGALTENGTIDFETFRGYFEFYSAMIDTDAYFDVVVRRMWGLHEPEQLEHVEVYPNYSHTSAGLAPGTGVARTSSSGAPLAPGSPRGPGGPKLPSSPTFESSQVKPMLFRQPRLHNADDYFAHIVQRLRNVLSKRGLKGWINFISGLQDKDDRSHGTIHKSQWTRLHRSLGLGLTGEDADLVFKTLRSDKDGGMEYQCLLDDMRGKGSSTSSSTSAGHAPLSPRDLANRPKSSSGMRPSTASSTRSTTANTLSSYVEEQIVELAKREFRSMASQIGEEGRDGECRIEVNQLLRNGFDAASYPLTVLRGLSPSESMEDFGFAVAFLATDDQHEERSFLTLQGWCNLIDLGLACFHTRDDMRLFATSLGVNVKGVEGF